VFEHSEFDAALDVEGFEARLKRVFHRYLMDPSTRLSLTQISDFGIELDTMNVCLANELLELFNALLSGHHHVPLSA